MTTNKQDYAALSDRELTQAVAERQGWRELDWFGYEIELENGPYKKVFWEGTNPEIGEEHEQVPDYATDPAAALELLREMNEAAPHGGDRYTLGYDRFTKLYSVEAVSIFGKVDDVRFGGDVKPARACCLAWLMWRDEQVAAR